MIADPDLNEAPSAEVIRDGRARLGDRVRTTPVWQWRSRVLGELLGDDTSVFVKLELFQYAGTFKPRGALLNMLALDPESLARGVTGVSAGNHAMALGYAAQALGTSAKVVMPENANPARVEGCRAYGAEVVLMPDVHAALDETHRIEEEEGRAFIHPFEGFWTATGTATVGLEWCEQAPGLDAVIVPVGGGGLLAGIAAAVKQIAPECRVFGVEPEGADSMHRSFAAGEPQAIDAVRTIADSLGAPHARPYSFSLCHRFVDDLVMIDDQELRSAMRLLFDDLKLAVEPACAAGTAALIGPLRERLRGRRVGVLACGSNIDRETFAYLVADG
ncbi:MAG: threonine/serine dehydratase [Thermoanaerobaculia bacterium]